MLTRICVAFDPPIDARGLGWGLVPRWSPSRGCTFSQGRRKRAIARAKRSGEIAARIMGRFVAPLLHQRLEFGVVPVRQDDAGGDEQVAGSTRRFRQPLALEA